MTAVTAQPTPDAALVAALLSDLHSVRQHLASCGPSIPSSTGLVCDVLQTGVTGDGCSAHYREAGREMRRLPPPPPAHVRLWSTELAALPGHSLRAYLVGSVEVLSLEPPSSAPLVVDSSDPKPRPVRVVVTLAQRVGWICADDAQRERWRKVLASRDRTAALLGMARAGESRLIECAREWSR